MRQARRREADMLRDAGDIKMVIGKVVADVLTGVTHAVIKGWIKGFVNRLHAPQQQLFEQVDRQMPPFR